MPVPSTIADLDAVAANNSPAGSESAKGTVDDYLRSHAAFIKQVDDKVLLRAPIASPTFTGTVGGVTAAMVGAVALTGNEAVAGVKTFSSSPVIPAPTTDLQAATKKYVDDSVVTVADASETVKGKIEIATSAETAALTDTERAIVPANLAAGVKAAFAATGDAPLFGVRAFANFSGAGTNGTNLTPRASGNIDTIYKNATGDYTITFADAMPDANYSIVFGGYMDDGAQSADAAAFGVLATTDETGDPVLMSTTKVRVCCRVGAGASAADPALFTFAVIR